MGIATRVNGAAPPDVPLSEADLGSWDFWGLDDDIREGTFATLRREAPVSFHESFVGEEFTPGAGHWALTRYDDVFYASRHPEIFSSAAGMTIGDQTPELSEYFGSMIAMDDPRHTRLRNIVRSAFTPRVLALIEDSVRDRARRLVTAMVKNHPDGKGEVVADLAGPLPLQIICDMMGIPEEDHQRVFHWTNVILGFGDPDIATDFDEFSGVAMDIGAYATALADDRRSNPGDDLTTSLVQAELDGERLTSAEVASFFILLVVAGNETTRNAISHGVLALSRYPDQRNDWWDNYDAVAPDGGRGDCPLGVARGLHAPHNHPRRRVERRENGCGRQGHAVVRVRQPRRVQILRSVVLRRAPSSQSACGLRRRWRAFLPGRQPGAP